MASPPSIASHYLSFDAYLAHDDGTDNRYELVNGQLISMPPESPENLRIAQRLFLEFIQHVPPLWVVWGTEVEVNGYRANCRLPDLLVHTAESWQAIQGAARSTLTRDMPPPALVVEVVSPGRENRMRDYRYKHTEYAARQIPEYWIVDPQIRQVTVCQWVKGQYLDRVFRGPRAIVTSGQLPQLALAIDRLFSP